MAATAPRVHRLANGVSVICEPMAGLESFALSVVAGRGSRLEPAERSGWSHLLEHMVFKGAGGRTAREIVEAIELTGGQINAATGHERTSFQIRALKGGLELGLRTCADLVLHPTLDAAELEREKQVVGQEIAESEDTPDDHVFELAQAAAFDGQPLGRPILGQVPTVDAAEPGSLGAWRDGLYAPDRLVISASGAVGEDELLALAEDAFGAAAGPALDAPETARFTGGLRPQRRRLEQAHLVFLLPGPGARHAHYYAARVFAEILGGGMSSRLFQEAREKRGLAYSVDAWAENSLPNSSIWPAACSARTRGDSRAIRSRAFSWALARCSSSSRTRSARPLISAAATSARAAAFSAAAPAYTPNRPTSA